MTCVLAEMVSRLTLFSHISCRNIHFQRSSCVVIKEKPVSCEDFSVQTLRYSGSEYFMIEFFVLSSIWNESGKEKIKNTSEIIAVCREAREMP